MPQTQKAFFLTAAHEYEISERAIPKPSSDEILVKVKSISLNPIEWKLKDHGFDFLIKEYPAVLGSDVAGDIVQVGKDVGDFKEGDKVFFESSAYHGSNYGAFQEYVLVPAEIASKMPPNLSYNEAASIPLALTTAAIGLLAPIPAGSGLNPTIDPNVKHTGQSAFVAGGGTSVGQFAIQLLKYLDFKHIITNSAAEHFDYLRSLGATDVIDRNKVPDNELPKIIQDIVGGKVDAAIDTVGSPASRAAAVACLKDGAHLGTVLRLPETEVCKGTMVRHIWGSGWVEVNREFGKVLAVRMGELFESGVLKPCRIVELSGGLDAIPGGLQDLKDNQFRGHKVVIAL
ncbi:hypothetical protein GYMLUDRAFT_171220 [Collybiopsis luxurians FD-317 M1]|uniref:Enoyl reductase (ER) domain-containing protein n=1 Tax=Collybiopsis luxurians FD-317 M1 TaxID=944289 RepID=A0A0D0BSJ8_9AGAR|nr:hypothetical protein GYMLUDRAFT_171220 [Collybiopsis luxurians FD-317 M1]